MKYLIAELINKENGEIQDKYFINEAFTMSNKNRLIKEAMHSISLELRKNNILPAMYKIRVSEITFKELNKSGTLKDYKFINIRKDDHSKVVLPKKPELRDHNFLFGSGKFI